MPFDGTDQRKPLSYAETLQLERLLAGRERIRHPYLWTQYIAPKGSTRPLMGRCAVEAIGPSRDRPYADCLELLAAQLPPTARRFGFNRSDLTHYNDDPRTTHADILNIYNKAIAALAERQ